MMFKGSPNVASGTFSRRVGREGGNDNAFTSRDVTAYYQQVEASRLPMIMAMEADRLAAALIPADEVESERRVVLEERRQRTDSNPRARFQEAFRAALWGPQTWPGRPIIGWEDEIRAISRDNLTDFHGAFLRPGQCHAGARRRRLGSRGPRPGRGTLRPRPRPRGPPPRPRAGARPPPTNPA